MPEVVTAWSSTLMPAANPTKAELDSKPIATPPGKMSHDNQGELWPSQVSSSEIMHKSPNDRRQHGQRLEQAATLDPDSSDKATERISCEFGHEIGAGL